MQSEERVQHACRDRNSNGIVSERKQQVFADIPNRHTTQTNGFDNLLKFTGQSLSFHQASKQSQSCQSILDRLG